MKQILIILGSPNSPEGKLGNFALSRLNYCVEIFDPDKNLIICTGGFGAHFNTSNRPHAEYAMEYLISKGIDKSFFLDIALSANTVEDAVKVKEIIMKNPLPCKIITSEYHLERVKIIFDQILSKIQKEYYSVKNEFSGDEVAGLIEHEKKAINEILKNGLYF